MKTEEITGASSIVNNARNEAFGCEISLLYFKKNEWENIAEASKKVMKKLGGILNTIQKNGIHIHGVRKELIRIKNNNLQRCGRFYELIKDENILQEHYKIKLSDKVRVFLSFDSNEKGYLMCYDNNHSINN